MTCSGVDIEQLSADWVYYKMTKIVSITHCASRKAIEKACRPKRQVKQIKEIVNVFKPISDHQLQVSYCLITLSWQTEYAKQRTKT